MSLLSALQNAVSGLNLNQTQMGLVSRNVANAGTVGYSRRISVAEETGAQGYTAGAVRQVGVQRALDTLLQKQIRTEAGGANYAATRADLMNRLDKLFGEPGASTGLPAQYAAFSGAMNSLAANPASAIHQQGAVGAAQSLAATFNTLSNAVQAMRSEADQRIAQQVEKANGYLASIGEITTKLAANPDPATQASLLDARDTAIDSLSSLVDLRVFDSGQGNYSLYTANGAPLFVQGRAMRLGFNTAGTIGADQIYDPTSASSALSGLTLSDPGGGTLDLNRLGLLRSGSLAALFEARDTSLVAAQNALDESAAALSASLSDTTRPGTATTLGAQAGFTLDLNNLQSGNAITLDYVIQPAGTKQRLSLVPVSTPAALPLPAGATPDPSDLEIGVDFSGGISAAITAIGTAIGAPFTVTDMGGGIVRILDDGAANTRDLSALSANITATTLTGGLSLPLFVDASTGNTPYTGSFDAGAQKRGFAQSIRVNTNLTADPAQLVTYQTTTLSGDPARPTYLADRLANAQTRFSGSSALSGSSASYQATTAQAIDRLLASTGQAANSAKALSDGQNVVITSLQERAASISGVSVDTEMSDLVAIQNAYAANARVVSAVRDLLDTLLRI